MELRYFSGSATHRVDAKGRVSLPADYRKVLAQYGSTHVVVIPLMKSSDWHVALSPAAYETIVEQIESMKLHEAEKQALKNGVVSNACPISVDDTGRITLTKELRDQLGIENEVRFVGQGSHFQLWEPGRWAAYDASTRSQSQKLARSVDLDGLH